MKICNDDKQTIFRFNDLGEGEVFYSVDFNEYCMKIEYIEDSSCDPYNAVSLSGGDLRFFGDRHAVVPKPNAILSFE